MRRSLVRDTPTGTVCRFKGFWGVLGKSGGDFIHTGYSFDQWDGPRIPLRDIEEVEVPESGTRKRGGNRWASPSDGVSTIPRAGRRSAPS